MSETAAARLRRILLLLPHLADGQQHAIVDLARTVGTDRETLLRDIETLVARDDDRGGFVPNVHIYYTGDGVTLTTYPFRRPMRLTPSELGALELGLAVLRAERPPDERREVTSALERLRRVMVRPSLDAKTDELRDPAAALHPVRAASLPRTGDTTVAALQRAVSDRRKVRLRYRRGASTDVSDRVIRPYALAVSAGSWYVVAHCESRGDVRSFRVDRVLSLEATAETYEIPASFSLDDFVNDHKVLQHQPPRWMRVRYSPRIARWIAEREGEELAADGSLTVEHPLADSEWGIRHVLQYGPDAEVLEPADVRSEIRRRLAELLTVWASTIDVHASIIEPPLPSTSTDGERA